MLVEPNETQEMWVEDVRGDGGEQEGQRGNEVVWMEIRRDSDRIQITDQQKMFRRLGSVNGKREELSEDYTLHSTPCENV